LLEPRPANGATRRRRSQAPGLAHARSTLRTRLEDRREELESAALTRVSAIADPARIADPAYADGLRSAVVAAIDFGLASIDSGEGNEPPIPVVLLSQARLAARHRISLDTVLRRYFAGYSLLELFLIEEAGTETSIGSAALQRLVATQSSRFDRMLVAIGEEYARESEVLVRPAGDRRYVERIERLLAGESVDIADIPYDFDGWHLALIASGPGAEGSVRNLAGGADCCALLVPYEEHVVWAWLGSRRPLNAAELLALFRREASPGVVIAAGEPAERLTGWRLTHRQAVAALRIAERMPEAAVSYGDAALLTAITRDDLLVDYLRRRYLSPLEADHDGGDSARETLHAYYRAQGNLTSAAALLGVSRQAVGGRLRTIEARINADLREAAVELRLALRMHELPDLSDRKAAS
jgi:hypothetical protein